MFKTLINAFREKEVRTKIFWTLLMLLIYRLGCFIPVPGLDAGQFSEFVGNDFLKTMSMISGGSLANGTLFALGIIPFINSFIIMQLLTLIIPPLERLSKEGDEGRKKLTQITRYVAIGLAAVQAVGILIAYNKEGLVNDTFGTPIVTMIFVAIILIGGSTFVMWLGERITEYGIGNGTSLLIFVGIIASFGSDLLTAITNLQDDINNLWFILGFLLMVLFVFVFIIFIDLSERRINIQYAKQIKGNKMYGGQSTHIPIRINASGVMPIIFASAFLMFPLMIANFWPTSKFATWYSGAFGAGEIGYIIGMFVLILFFAFFYAQIQFNPDDIARNIQQYVGFIPGIRPGKPTSMHLAKINNRITLFGAIFLAFISLVPSIGFSLVGTQVGLNNAFSATGMLIVVRVALEFDIQLESQLMMRHYKGFLK
jgi:preprotein translocase subunit SecY